MIFFWLNIVLLTVALLVVLQAKGADFASFPTTNVSSERYAIILTLALIPASLKLFHSYHQKIKELEQDTFLRKYTIAYYLRIVIFDIAVILNLTGFQLYNTQNTMYLTIMIIFVLFFCYPNKIALQNEFESEESENIN
jgi:hypothetical protein